MKAITHSRRLVVTTLLGAALLPPPVIAEQADPAAAMPAGDVFGIAAVDGQDLALSRGGAQLDLTLNDATSHGVVGGNQAANLTTGSNYINGEVFSNSAGFSTVVQNSGNNVLIQNATVVNVKVY